MALSGKITGDVTQKPYYFSFYITWSAKQNISGNYSDVTVTSYWETNNTYQGFDTMSARDASITINGETSSIRKVFDTTGGSGSGWAVNPLKIQEYTQRVQHNGDGTKTISISARANGHADVYGPSSSTDRSADCVASGTITLDTIPRAASITTAPDFNDEENPTITYSNPAGNNVTSLQACISLTGATDDISYRDISKTGSSYTFNLTESERNVLRKATTGSNSRKVKFYVRTIIGGETYHSPLEKNFSIINYTPTFPVDNIGYYDSNTSISNITGNSEMIVQNQSNLVVQYTAATPKKSASISTYYFKLNGVTKTSTSAGGTISFGKINSGSNITLTAWCVDNRGNKSADVSKTIKCYEYYQPSFTSFNSYRANSDGNPNVNGKYLKNIYSTNYPSVGGKNKIKVEFTYITGSTSKTTADSLINLGEDSKTYSVYATITDSFGGRNSSSTITVFGSTRIFNVSKDGTGFAIGKMAEIPEGYPGIFECRWPAKFDSNLMVGDSSQSSTPTCGITVHDVRNADITPESFGDKNVNFYFDNPNGYWESIIHMKGWTGNNYAAWELAGNAHNNNKSDLHYRQGIGNTWDSWQTVLTDKNIGNYAALNSSLSSYLPLSGGTLTGELKLSGGLDCQNSDIINANGICFKDLADSAGEGINFYRSSGYWDSLYAKNGVLKFHPNRGTSTGLSGSTIYHSGNLGTLEIATGTCTLNCNANYTISFNYTFSDVPRVMLTPRTHIGGIIPGKVNDISSTAFTGTIGGNATSDDVEFMWVAVYWKGE